MPNSFLCITDKADDTEPLCKSERESDIKREGKMQDMIGEDTN